MPSAHRAVAVKVEGAGARIGQRRDLDRLLVEPRGSVLGSRSSHGSDGEMPMLGLMTEQPLQQIQPALHERRTIESRSGRNHRLGESGVRVGEARFGPGPSRVSAGPGHCVSGVRQEAAGRHVVGVGLEELGGAERGKSHGPAASGERWRIARSIARSAKPRTWWSSLRDAAVPSPQMALPQQSSSVGASSHPPLRFIRFRHRPTESSAPSRNLTLSVAR